MKFTVFSIYIVEMKKVAYFDKREMIEGIRAQHSTRSFATICAMMDGERKGQLWRHST